MSSIWNPVFGIYKAQLSVTFPVHACMLHGRGRMSWMIEARYVINDVYIYIYTYIYVCGVGLLDWLYLTRTCNICNIMSLQCNAAMHYLVSDLNKWMSFVQMNHACKYRSINRACVRIRTSSVIKCVRVQIRESVLQINLHTYMYIYVYNMHVIGADVLYIYIDTHAWLSAQLFIYLCTCVLASLARCISGPIASIARRTWSINKWNIVKILNQYIRIFTSL